ncbi:MAG: hypothetical protein MPI95_06985 [Nitrosopumilus sp.]|nr:hypothetical protein [Nitrosopumilus sp.]CAI9830929.1 membrane hypothetical protein [Nitrosopumilaceae archaeon]MDA7944101.1 hypothetical protein [Nitrosopumilus sp.]MDA7944907.1 hypothetical protein [Nitrosopumilus sp.]MDA7955566.1 hypothetical protein [Nitrosopumilus sp.]
MTARAGRAWILSWLRIPAIVMLVAAVFAAAMFATVHFAWILSPYGGCAGGPLACSGGNVAAVLVAAAVIVLASWSAFLLADASRIAGTCSRLAGLLHGRRAGPTAADLAFACLAASVAVVFAYLAVDTALHA